MYEVRNRSVSDHEAYSFDIDRQNLNWLAKANKDFCREIMAQNDLDELRDHGKLSNAIFRRKPITVNRMQGVVGLGVAGLSIAYFPILVHHLGHFVSTFGMCAASIYGMTRFKETNVVNTITLITQELAEQLAKKYKLSPEVVKGKLLVNISSSMFRSSEIIVSQ